MAAGAKMGEGHSTRVHLTMSQSELPAVDEWRRRQPDLSTRAEATAPDPVRANCQGGDYRKR
jgi:hypothetical protein